jgi:hypothetical protein
VTRRGLYRRNPEGSEIEALLPSLLSPDKAQAIVSQFMRETTLAEATGDNLPLQFKKIAYLIDKSKSPNLDRDSIKGQDFLRAQLASVSDDDADKFVASFNKSKDKVKDTPGTYLLELFSEGISDTYRPTAVLTAIKAGQLTRALFAQLAYAAGYESDPIFTTDEGIRLLAGLPPAGAEAPRTPPPAEEEEPQERQAAASAAPGPREERAEDEEPPRGPPTGDPSLEPFVTRLLEAYAPLRAAWRAYAAQINSDKNISEVSMRTAYAGYVAALNTYLQNLAALRDDARSERLLVKLGQYIQAHDQKFQNIYSRISTARTLEARQSVTRDATAEPLMATGRPLVRPSPSNARNEVLSRQVESDYLRGLGRTEQAFSRPPVRTADSKVRPVQGQISTVMARRSGYNSNKTISVPAAWMVSGKLPDLRQATTIRLSPDLSYLILSRKGGSVLQYMTAHRPSTPGFYADAQAMIAAALSNEKVFRDLSPSRETAPIYLVHAGNRDALRLYAGTKSGIATPMDIDFILANLVLGPGGVTYNVRNAKVPSILTDVEAEHEKEDFNTAMAVAGVMLFPETPTVSPEFFTGAEPPGAEEASAGATASAMVVSLFVTPYEQDDDRLYAKTFANLFTVADKVAVASSIDLSKWAKLQPQAAKRDEKLLAYLLDAAKASGRPIHLYAVGVDRRQTPTVDNVTLHGVTSVPSGGVTLFFDFGNESLVTARKVFLHIAKYRSVINVFVPMSGNAGTYKQYFSIMFDLAFTDILKSKKYRDAQSRTTSPDQVQEVVDLVNKSLPGLNASVQEANMADYIGNTVAYLVESLVYPIMQPYPGREDTWAGIVSGFTNPPEASGEGETPVSNPYRRALRNDGRRRRVEYVARAFQRVTS